VNRQNLLLRTICGLLACSFSHAAFARPAAGPPASQVESHALVLRERFRFHAGAPLIAPAGIADDGTVCVGTSDGYVHLLAPDGAYRWSFTVRGSVTRRPLLVAGLWLIVSNADRVYALTPGGTLSWIFRPPAGVASELAATTLGPAYFVGEDDSLYALGSHGGVVLSAAFGKLSAGPELAESGLVWLKNQHGQVAHVRGIELVRVAPGAPAEFTFAEPDRPLTAPGVSWQTETDGSLIAISAPTGTTARLQVARSPLLPARWSEHEHELLVSAREGWVVAVRAGEGEAR